MIKQPHDGLFSRKEATILKALILYECLSKSSQHTAWVIPINGIPILIFFSRVIYGPTERNQGVE